MDGKSVKEFVQQTIQRIDTGDFRPVPHRFHSSKWLRKFVAPAAIGISIGLCSCGNSAPEYGAPFEDADHSGSISDADFRQDADEENDTDVIPDADISPDADEPPDADEETDGSSDADAEPDADNQPDSSADADEPRDADTRPDGSPDADADDTPDAGSPEDCRDETDNDLDGLCDCVDPDCRDDEACMIMCPLYGGPFFEGNCSDCRDGPDCDGLVDCDDPDCDDDPACL